MRSAWICLSSLDSTSALVTKASILASVASSSLLSSNSIVCSFIGSTATATDYRGHRCRYRHLGRGFHSRHQYQQQLQLNKQRQQWKHCVGPRERHLTSEARTSTMASAVSDSGSTEGSSKWSDVNDKESLVQEEEIILTCSDGIRLAAQRHRHKGINTGGVEADTAKVLCLHGWMDNAKSFHHLAPEIALNVGRRVDADVEVVSLDFPGHGLSGHKSIDGPPTVITELAYYVHEALCQLQWIPTSDDDVDKNSRQRHHDDGVGNNRNGVIIVSHSMGSSAGLMYASSFPEHVKMLVLLEGLGPLCRQPRDAPSHIRSHVERRHADNELARTKARKAYPSLAAAAQTRCRAAKFSPGDQWLSLEASKIMVGRGTEPVGDDAGDDAASREERPVQFRHDPRLQLPSSMYFSSEQVEAMYQDVKCPTAVFLAKNGWPILPPTSTSSSSSPSGGGVSDNQVNTQQQQLRHHVQERSDRFRSLLKLLRPATVRIDMPGSHHFHADPDTAPIVAKDVIDFIVKQLEENKGMPL